MKKSTFILVICAMVSCSAFAQLEKGYWIGKIQGSFRTELQWQSIDIKLQPQAMKLVANNFAVGLQANYELSKLYTRTEQILALNALAQKYFWNKPLKPFIGLSVGAGMSNIKNTSYGTIITTDYGFLVNMNIGISWWINENASIDLSTGYGIKDKVDSFDGIKLGVGFKFGKPSE